MGIINTAPSLFFLFALNKSHLPLSLLKSYNYYIKYNYTHGITQVASTFKFTLRQTRQVDRMGIINTATSLLFSFALTKSPLPLSLHSGGGGGGVQAYHFEKKDFELGVGWKGQDTYRHFKGIFGSIRAILPV